MSRAEPTVHGLYVDLVAPCAANGDLLPREFHVHLRRMARIKDVQGVIVNGPAGEAEILGRENRMKILRVAVSASPSGFPLLAAIPSDISCIAEEAQAAIEAGATGIVVISTGLAGQDRTALKLAVEAVPDVPVVTMGVPLDVAASVTGIAAIVANASDLLVNSSELPIMLTDQNFALKAIEDGVAVGAVLASANIAEAHWGKIFRYATDAPDQAMQIFSERVEILRDTLIAIGDSDSRRMAAAIKHGLFSMTQNTSAATFPPLVEIGDEARNAIANALINGRLMPGMV